MPIVPLSNRASLVGPHEFYLLKILLNNSDSYELIPKDIIEEEIDLNPSQLDFYLSKLLKLKLIYHEKNLGKDSFKITFSGIDVLSIKKLYEMKILKSLSTVIGEGKESVVYMGYDFDENPIVVKFHRIGKTSYKTLRRKKRTLQGRKSWVRLSIENAESEYNALACLWENRAYVPRPLGLGVNAVAMEYINGKPLFKTDLLEPSRVLDDILSTIRISYVYCKLSHNDLSPYNVVMDTERNIPYVIDWPQASRASEDSLEKDIRHILDFFRNKYDINREINDTLSYIRD
ncbi:RIO-type serine/threonine-protein kinase Rio2 [Sulfuracidifex tepidarius]|uniref:non-specific serine/threonine protein kinase n=2 Tax=Sulfuracidifex tepidarius TaxID=1294262 RepID=A0A510DWD1_9CREN|nr:RIO-type serine/threonine-protein kinase Rio2 [Sulfuracidifex tepidarius]